MEWAQVTKHQRRGRRGRWKGQEGARRGRLWQRGWGIPATQRQVVWIKSNCTLAVSHLGVCGPRGLHLEASAHYVLIWAGCSWKTVYMVLHCHVFISTSMYLGSISTCYKQKKIKFETTFTKKNKKQIQIIWIWINIWNLVSLTTDGANLPIFAHPCRGRK